jgi:hypothetical protein
VNELPRPLGSPPMSCLLDLTAICSKATVDPRYCGISNRPAASEVALVLADWTTPKWQNSTCPQTASKSAQPRQRTLNESGR